ncbi:MAG: sporulation integral membrane protein YtvI [Clostridia bacterium]|nr:sporulation integral membrane protein YtvI [Clostridia bacterium]
MSKKVKVGMVLAVSLALLVLVAIFFSEIIGFLGWVVRLFMPFILGYFFSLLANPLADLLEKRFKLPRAVSAVLVILLCIGVIGGILTAVIMRIVEEIRTVFDNFPAIYVNITNVWTEVSTKLSNIYNVMPKAIQNVLGSIGENIAGSADKMAGVSYTPIFTSAKNIALGIPGMFVSLIVFLLSAFFMITDAKKVREVLLRCFSQNFRDKMSKAKIEIKKYVGGYIKAQFIIMTFAFVILFVGLNILGVKYAFLIALGTAIFDALPFFGSGAVLWPWAAISFLTGKVGMGIGLLIIYLAVIFTRQMIEPKIVSQNIGMNPILTLMSMYVGYRVLSIGGMILGPLILMFIISLKRAGFFDGIIEFIKLIKATIKKEYNALKTNLRSEDSE